MRSAKACFGGISQKLRTRTALTLAMAVKAITADGKLAKRAKNQTDNGVGVAGPSFVFFFRAPLRGKLTLTQQR